MRVIRGFVNAVLMVTLVKPVVRLFVARWRKRVQESAATTIGLPVQELLEAALIEELSGPATESQPEASELMEEVGGRSTIRSVLLAGIVLVAVSAAGFAIAGLIKRRREEAEQVAERDLVAVPIEESPSQADQRADEVELTQSA